MWNYRWGVHSWVSDPLGLGWCPRKCISPDFPGDAELLFCTLKTILEDYLTYTETDTLKTQKKEVTKTYVHSKDTYPSGSAGNRRTLQSEILYECVHTRECPQYLHEGNSDSTVPSFNDIFPQKNKSKVKRKVIITCLYLNSTQEKHERHYIISLAMDTTVSLS